MPAPDSPDAILTPELAAFVHGGVVVMVGSASPELAPALTRGFAPRVAPDRRSLEVFVGRAQGTTCLANLAPGAPMAVIIGSPINYRGIQLKGAAAGQRDAGDGDAGWLERYRLLYVDTFGRVGITPAQCVRLWCHDMVSITVVPAAIFSQTPGPGAGNPLASGPPWT